MWPFSHKSRNCWIREKIISGLDEATELGMSSFDSSLKAEKDRVTLNGAANTQETVNGKMSNIGPKNLSKFDFGSLLRARTSFNFDFTRLSRFPKVWATSSMKTSRAYCSTLGCHPLM